MKPRVLSLPKAQAMPRQPEVPTLTVHFSLPVPDVSRESSWEHAYRYQWNVLGQQFVDALLKHAPGGLVDAIFGHLAKHKASLYTVAHDSLKGGHMAEAEDAPETPAEPTDQADGAAPPVEAEGA